MISLRHKSKLISTCWTLCKSNGVPNRIAPIMVVFVLAIELLAIAIRQAPDIEEVLTEQNTYQINLFADDMLLFLSKLETSLQALQMLLGNFALLSGLQINHHQSVNMPINLSQAERNGLQQSHAYE